MPGGSIDYDEHAAAYPAKRRADPRIAARVLEALGDARSVLNVGAGTGSYEPRDRYVLAVEPSAGMRAQRPADLAPTIDACAEALPLDAGSFDAAMAMITIHHWRDPRAGLCELRRVARERVVVLTFDPAALGDFWLLADYLPEALADDRRRFPSIEEVVDALGGARVESIPIPADCSDGFLETYFARPEAFLDPAVRRAQSIWPRLPPDVEQRALAELEADLRSGAWDQRHGELRRRPSYEGALRLVVSCVADGLT
jgi:SAM-dependent methyltransferase